MNQFYSDLFDMDDIYGFCVDGTAWGPSHCFNDQQDASEDGVDCWSLSVN